jgi:NitT/TauT family transport system substrate-binding protein
MEKTMSRNFMFVVVSICFVCFYPQNGQAQEKSLEKVSLAIQWLTQCQFAGYYVALDRGFYEQEGIDLTIIPGASDINPIHLVSSGAADFGTKWIADFLVAKEEGLPLISIAQILQSNGLVLIAKAESGIKTPQDFIGKKLGIWFFGNETQFFTLMNKFNIPLDQMHIEELKWSIEPFLNNEFDVITAMIYNEYLRILDGGDKKEEMNIIDFAEYGLNFPGQVIFTKTAILKKQPDLCERMVRASLQGWAWAMDNPEKAVDIVLKNDKTKSLKRDLQLKQMKAVIKLIKYGNRPLGYHQPDQVLFVMNSLVQNKVISHSLNLSDVYTNKVWENAQKGERNQP